MRTSARRSLRHRLAEDLRGRVLAGEFPAGTQLPSEPDLARSLKVARSSLRAAMALLEDEGLLRRRQGSGTYVTHRPRLQNDLSRNFSVSGMIAAAGLEAGTLLAQARTEIPPAEVAAAFELEAGATVSVLRRVRTAGGRPVVDSADWCRSEVLDPAALTELGDGSIYNELAARGLSIHHGVATLRPTKATRELARRLHVSPGALLLTLFQVDRTADGVVILVSREHYLADASVISVYRRGPGDGGEDQM